MVELRVWRRCTQHKRKRGRGGAWDKKATEEEHKALEAILSFLNDLFASVNLKILQRNNSMFLIMFGSLKIPIEIGVPGFPGGAVVENLPANAGDTGSSPGLGRSHMPRSSWAREPQLLSLRVWRLCSATREAAIVRGLRAAMKGGPCSLQLEKALAQKRRPNTAKNINK